MNRLMIGAGSNRRPGWKTLDADVSAGADFLVAIPPLPDAVKQVAWDEVEWVHGITSLYPWDAEQALQEIRRAMAPGGKLILEQPDARIAARRVLETGSPAWLFGDPSLKAPLLMNRWAHTPESLSALLCLVGFRLIETLPALYHVPSRDFRLEAIA